MMGTLPADKQQAHDYAATLVSGKYRQYLFVSGRMLPVLLARFRDDMAEALGVAPPDIPRRDGQVRPARLGELTSSEFDVFSEAVTGLADGATILMDDQELPRLLRELQGRLRAEQDERERIADDITAGAKAKAS
jgi:hypothetical protein